MRAVWGRGFRPFFLAAALQGALWTPAWTAMWLGAFPAPAWLTPPWWHGHEMLFGLVAAAIAGFLLTSVPVWTGTPAVAGRPLAALVALWAAGRVAMLAAGPLPPVAVAALDAAFLPVLAAVLARRLARREQRRNQGILAVVAALALANAATHADALGLAPGAAPRALRLAVDGVALLIAVIGGRITPQFTANALRRAGRAAPVRARPWADRLALGALAALLLVDLVAPRSAASGAAAALAGAASLARMGGWQTRRTGGEPLLWSLHAGMAWLGAGLLLVAAGDLGAPVPASAGLHALTAGAMGAMILAVMTRVSLGHTGRPLVLPAGAALSYALVHAGALARVASPFAPPAGQRVLLGLAGALWAGAFAWFALRYAPILLAPRVDGRPG